MEPTLGITYETPHHLNLALANYGVAHGFQLWFMKNDWRKVLVYCGRNVVEGRCAGKKGNKDRLMPSKVRTGVSKGKQGNKYVKNKAVKKKFCKEIIEDPFTPLRKMRDDIKHKFMIDVSIGQQALLDSNPGSTCILDVDESANRSATFKRMYICFKGVKDGWLAGCRKLEVRKGDHSYGVNLQHKVCQCRMWELSGVPCVHVMAAYMHVGTDLDVGVSFWYSQESWFNAYQFSIKPVFRSYMWKRTNDVPPLPPLIRKMHDRPQKARIKSPCETSGSHVSRVGRTMTYKNCWQKGHNKASCNAEPQPKPIVEKKQPSRKKHVVVRQCASRGGGSFGRGDGNDGSSSGMGGRGDASGRGIRGSGSGGRGGGTSSRGVGRGKIGGGMADKGSGRGSRGGGRGRRGGGMAGSSSMGALTDEERDESIEEAPYNQQYHEIFILIIHSQPIQQLGIWVKDTTVTIADIKEAPVVETSDTTKMGEGKASTIVQDESALAMDKGKAVE
ncbi:zinc finger, PMZ-type containing protein [Tanacetum coccineum]